MPWCENDYQIDVATPAGRTEWKRILDQCAAVGVEHTLFTPANGAVPRLKDNADAWGWENCLWLGLGQKIRKGEWQIATDPIPPVHPGNARLREGEERETASPTPTRPSAGSRIPSGPRGAAARRAGTSARTRASAASRTGSSTSWSPSRSGPASAATASITGGSPTSRTAKASGRPASSPVVRLPADLRGTPPPRPRHRDRRPPAVPMVRAVDLAGRLVSPSDDQRRAARQLQEISRTCTSAASRPIGSGGRPGGTAWNSLRRWTSCPAT